MQIGPKINEIGACACVAFTTIYRCICKKQYIYIFFQISRFLDVSNVSSMPHLPRNLIVVILLFYRTILSCLEAEKCVKFDFTM